MENLVDKNPRKDDGWTPLHYAAKKGHLDICKLICKNIEDKNPKDNYGLSPIFLANGNGHMEIVSYLKEVNSMGNHNSLERIISKILEL